MTHIYDLLDQEELAQAIEVKHVREQFHPTEPLAILNYTDTCAYDEHWSETTLQCRGLIYNTTDGEVVARPFPKFFNYGQPGAAEIPLDRPVSVTDKADGSLGILYPLPSGGHAVATRGSFTSEQAIFATNLYNAKYAAITEVDPEWTTLVEVIAPWNRIVLDYGDIEDLYLLGAVNIENGRILEPAWDSPYIDWHGPRVEMFNYYTLAEALRAEPRPNAEGLVVRQHSNGNMIKIKQADYQALHSILTNTSARTIWTFMAVNACKDLIKQTKHWGSYLGIDPARAVEILAVEGNWKATVLDGVPDEFYTWVSSVIARINDEVEDRIARGLRKVIEVNAIVGDDALAAYRMFESDPLDKELMRVYRGGSSEGLTLKAWRLATPGVELPFARTEEAA